MAAFVANLVESSVDVGARSDSAIDSFCCAVDRTSRQANFADDFSCSFCVANWFGARSNFVANCFFGYWPWPFGVHVRVVYDQ